MRQDLSGVERQKGVSASVLSLTTSVDRKLVCRCDEKKALLKTFIIGEILLGFPWSIGSVCVFCYHVKEEIFTSSNLLENLGNFMKLQICPNMNGDCTAKWCLIERRYKNIQETWICSVRQELIW